MKNNILIRLEQSLIFVYIKKKFKYRHMLNNNSIERFIIVKGIFRGIHQPFWFPYKSIYCLQNVMLMALSVHTVIL